VNKKSFAISLMLRLLIWLILPATARASVSEVRKDFLNLSSLLPASPIMACGWQLPDLCGYGRCREHRSHSHLALDR